jgi:RimJ/RimL family protein N-acetyltransferase
MKHSYFYGYQHVKLRPLEYEDIENLRILRNENRKAFVNQSLIQEEQQFQWYQTYLQKTDDIMFAVELLRTPGTTIGFIAAYDIDWEKKTCEIGRTLIDKTKAPDKGLGREATVCISAFVFNELRLEKIVCEVLKENVRTLISDIRAGFTITSVSDLYYELLMTPMTVRL